MFSSIWIDTKDSRIRTHDPDGPVFYANHALNHLLGLTPTQKKNLTSFETVLNPNQ